jgi:hypothetical protein
MANVFYWLGGIGCVVIVAICLAVLENPFEIVGRGMVMDYNKLSMTAVPITMMYYFLLWGIYKAINFFKSKRNKVESK